MLRNIRINFIPHNAQRYETVGDWRVLHDGETWQIDVSMMKDWRHNVLVAVHELVEMAQCIERGIDEQTVTDFDLQFEATRAPNNEDEPGWDPQAPYRAQHIFAENIERELADQLRVDWSTYEAEILSLDQSSCSKQPTL